MLTAGHVHLIVAHNITKNDNYVVRHVIPFIFDNQQGEGLISNLPDTGTAIFSDGT